MPTEKQQDTRIVRILGDLSPSLPFPTIAFPYCSFLTFADPGSLAPQSIFFIPDMARIWGAAEESDANSLD